MTLPPGFIDRWPHRGPWPPPSEPPPLYAWGFQALLADGRTVAPAFMGTYWWDGEYVEPVGWRWIENREMAVGTDVRVRPEMLEE